MLGGIRKKIFRLKNKNPLSIWPDTVVSNKFGVERGTPIDRFFIEQFLENHRNKISGDVYEIGDNEYTVKFGCNNYNSHILTADKDDSRSNVIIGDLQSGDGCEENICDCFILTQTLPFIFDVHSAAKNIVKMLRPGGVALVTVSGISMISMYDYERWGHYWGFTEQSLQKLFLDVAKANKIELFSYGNPKLATGFVYGLCQEDYSKKDFEYHDEVTPVTICAIVTK